MMSITVPTSADFLISLATLAMRALALAGAAGLALAIGRAKSTSARLFTWKAVLCAALAMPLLTGIMPEVAIPTTSVSQLVTRLNRVPRDSAPKPQGIRAMEIALAPKLETRKTAIPEEQSMAASQPNIAHNTAASIPWTTITTALYLVVAGLFLVRIAVGHYLTHRLMRNVRPIGEANLAALLTRRARSFELASVPTCAESEIINVPSTLGILRPTILLPSNWSEWDDSKLEAVITHEMSHIVRRDALTQMLSLLHRAMFWFSPLAWWLDRHLAELAEQASDEAVLVCGTESDDYAKTLLGFFQTLHAAPGRVWWQGVAMAKAGSAERRLEQILAWKKTKGSVMNQKRFAAVVLVVAVPAILLAASIRPSRGAGAQAQSPAAPAPYAQAAPSVPQGPTAPAAAAAQGTVYPPSARIVTNNGVTFVAPPAPTEPVAPVSSPTPPAAWSGQAGRRGYSYAYSDDDDERYVIVSGKTDSLTMSGTTQDARHVERLRRQIAGDFIWFQRDEKSYIIRDQATIDRARAFWAPQEELGRKQGELGKQQGELGKQQEALGRKMSQVKVDVPDMTAALDKLKAELKALGPTASQDQLGHIQSEIGDLQSRIGEMQSHAGDQQSKVGEEMSALGEQQSALGEQQSELGRQQEEASREASHKMKELLDEAIKNGKAQPESQNSGGASL